MYSVGLVGGTLRHHQHVTPSQQDKVEEELNGKQAIVRQNLEVCITIVLEGFVVHAMSMVDGRGIGTIFLLGGHGCHQGG